MHFYLLAEIFSIKPEVPFLDFLTLCIISIYRMYKKEQAQV